MLDLVDWVDSNIERARPSAGDEWTGECPFCGRYGGFYVNCSDEGKGPFVCFKCDERSTSAVRLIAHVEDITPHEARALLLKSKVEFRRRETATSLLDRIKAIRGGDSVDDIDLLDDKVEGELPPEFIPVWDGKRWRVPTYMTKRGYKRSVLKAWGVGFCNGGRYARRVIIPLICPNGQSFTARDITGEQLPKYLNPKGIDHRRLLFGWNRVADGSDFALVEGPLDSMKLDQHRLPAMAMGGKVLHAEQLNMLFKRPRTASVTVMLDPEAMKEAFNVAAQLMVHFDRVYVAELPEDIDPGDSTRRVAHEAHDGADKYAGEREKVVRAAIKNAWTNLQKRFED